MATKSMLVSYVGYPNEAFNLMPDNGLANLAACLIRAGHETIIEDCSTVSMISLMYPHDERALMKSLKSRVLSRLTAGGMPDHNDLDEFYAMEDRIDTYQDSKIRSLGRELAKRVHDLSLDFVGFKLWTGAGFHGAIALAKEIRRENPNVKIFGGGPHNDWFMERSFDVTDAFDVMAYGEGEETVVGLAEYVEGRRRLREVPNVIFRENGELVITPQTRVEDLDDLPLPCYDPDVYPAMRGNEKLKVVLVDESRGCPNSCNFCLHPLKSGKRRRSASPEAFVDRLTQLRSRYGFRAFRFAGSNPPITLRTEIAREILRRGMDVTFSAFAHVRLSGETDFSLLRRAGCRALSFGVESGSQRILDESINKKVKVSDIREALTRCKAAGIFTSASVIVPAPNETEETKEETFRLLCDLKPDSVLVSFPALMLGTAWDRERERFGFELDNIETFRKQLMTHRLNTFAPAALWRPLAGYRLNGKGFHALGKEAAGCVQRLGKAGITTQLFDSVFLIAEHAGMPPEDFGKLMARFMEEGDASGISRMVAKINASVRDGASDAA